jgi:hypothetical protein
MLDERNPVWAGAPRLFAYMSRLNMIMRAGESVVPVAMFLGDIGYYVGIEDKGLGAQAREKGLIAAGFDFDRINPDGLKRSQLSGKDLLTPGGHPYAALVLPAVEALRPDAALRIAELAEAGLPVIFTGHAPRRSEGLKDHAANDAIVRHAMARAIRAGARIVPEAELPATLRAIGIRANLRFLGDASDLVFVERRIGKRSFYFIYNRGQTDRTTDFVTPARGGAERWDAMNGSTQPVSSAADPAGTKVTLTLAGGQSALIVIDPAKQPEIVRQPSKAETRTLPVAGWTLSLRGHVTGGAPLEATRRNVSLGDWSADPELAHFSGTGAYSTSFDLPAGWLRRGAQIRLDLGAVHDMATVSINGRVLPALISKPWTLNVAEALREGKNRIEVAVANVPQNAMIDPKSSTFRKLAPVPAGLVGPVKLTLSWP